MTVAHAGDRRTFSFLHALTPHSRMSLPLHWLSNSVTHFFSLYVLNIEHTDFVKKYMEYEVEGSRPRGRPKRTWREVVQKKIAKHVI